MLQSVLTVHERCTSSSRLVFIHSVPSCFFPRRMSSNTATTSSFSADRSQAHSYQSQKNSLYSTFMGSSSRFTLSHSISSPRDILTLEHEPLTHFSPQRLSDHCCIYLVKFLRWCADKLFRERYIHRATMLKTISAAPPFVGAIITYFRMMLKKGDKASLSGSTNIAEEVRGLMSQAESHAFHAFILMSMTEITYTERVMVLFFQVAHGFIFFLLFLLYPQMAFRLMGYMCEESVVIWTHMINDIAIGKVGEQTLPQVAFDYWGLHHLKVAEAEKGYTSETSSQDYDARGQQNETYSEEGVTLRDVILLLRSDEMIWRDMCHKVATKMDQT